MSNSANSILGTIAFRNLKLEQDGSIFSKVRTNFTPSSPFTHIAVNNNHLILAMANKILIKIDLAAPTPEIEEIDISKHCLQAKIFAIFLDPTGQHVIISLVERDNSTPQDILYLPWKSNKVRVCAKLKNFLVTSLAWNSSNEVNESTTVALVGTSKGIVFEIELTSDESYLTGGVERNFRQLFDLSKEDTSSFITNLAIFNHPTEHFKKLVLITTPDKLHQYSGYVTSIEGSTIYGNIFQNYVSSPNKGLEYATKWVTSWLNYYKSLMGSHGKIESQFGWMNGKGVYIGKLDWNTDFPDVTSNGKFHAYPDTSDLSTKPCNLVVTKFHILVVWPHKIVGICILSDEVIFEDSVPDEYGRMIGICRDEVKGTIWLICERAVYKFKVENEGRNVWKIYLKEGKYGEARENCGNDEASLSLIMLKEAEDLFEKQKYIQSAKLFTKTPSSFEEICLKFVEVEADDALKLFLQDKLDSLKANEETQITIIVMWLLELHLKKLGTLRDTEKRNTPEYRALDEEFKSLLRDQRVRECVNQNASAVYSLLTSHDDQDNYVGVAIMMADFNRVVLHLMSHGRHKEALVVMSTQCSEKLFYQHTPALLQVIPSDTINALISRGRGLDPMLLLPSLVHAHASFGHSSEVLRYLEFCIDELEVKDQVLHNFLITLYCVQSPDNLLTYLNLQGDDMNAIDYDIKYALRECMTAGHDKACINILTTMGLYKEAIELALKVDTNLAKAIANRTKYDEAMCKKLWLMIAAHVVKEEKDVTRAMDVLKECSLINIEDILPFFPDFVTIDQFKDAICKSLQEYNEHINNLKGEMDEASKSAANIRADIKKFKQKHSIVNAEDKCSECDYPLLTRAFYLFPCEHKFHQDCLSDAVINFLSNEKQKLVSELKGKLLAMANDESNSFNTTSSTTFWNEKEQIRDKIDAIIGFECLYCGEIAVNNVDRPFIIDEEWDYLKEEWQ